MWISSLNAPVSSPLATRLRSILKNGASRVLISAPGANADQTIVYGVNHGVLSASDVIVSNASLHHELPRACCQVLNDSIGISKGFHDHDP